MISSVRPSVTAIKAATTSVAAVASNVVNMRNSGRLENAQVDALDRSRHISGQPPPPDDLYRPVRADNVTLAGGGVRAVMHQTDPPHVAEFDPGDPNADADGVVARPKVDVADEMVRLRQARDSYSANLKVLQTADEMAGYLLDRRA